MPIKLLQKIDVLKNKIDVHRPIERGLLKQIREYFRIGLTYSSNALEGNSLTETETKIVIEDGISIGGKPIRDHLEALGHAEAYEHLYGLARKEDITEADIKSLHRLFYYRIDSGNAGEYRKQRVIIMGTDFIPPPPKKIPELMKQFVSRIPDYRAGNHPVEYAAILHKEIAVIHPFIDGNGRTARLLMNLALLQAGYPIAVIPPILRRDYLIALEKVNRGDERMFIKFIAGTCYESAKEYLRLLEG